MNFKEHLERTWKLFTDFLPALLINTIGLVAISIISLGILAPVAMAGYMQSLLLAIREDRKPELGDLLSQMRLFLPLLGFTIVAGIALMIGFAMLVLPGIIMLFALVFFCLYMIPLMTDQDMGLIEAIKESSRMALEEPVVEHIAVAALYIAISAIGQSFIFGTLFTQPFATLFILLIFEQKTRQEVKTPQKTAADSPASQPQT